MIIRHIPMKKAKLSSFSGLVRYITDPQNKEERVGKIRISNCNSIDTTWAIQEVLATQSKNQRVKADKTYHLLVSFAAGDVLSASQLNAIEDSIVSAIGFKDNQRISTVHHDTDNLHIHIAINKIHPKTLKMIEPYRAYKTFAEVAAKLEREYGLEMTNHQTRKGRSENLADDMEQHSGIESLINWMKTHCKASIESANNWKELHNILAKHGLTIKPRANGFVFCDKNGLMVKASSISRNLSQKNLISRLGEFIPDSSFGGYPPKNTYRCEPLNRAISNSELYARYQNERMSNKTLLSDKLKILRTAKINAIEKVKKRAQLKRAALKLMKMPKIQKKYLYAQISKTLLNDIDIVRGKYTHQRDSNINIHRNRTWADWLRYKAQTGDQDALVVLREQNRKNNAKFALSGASENFSGTRFCKLDSITKQGTEIYKIDKGVIRNDGHEIKISRGGSVDTLMKALDLARQLI